jgi:hypothetical protein
MGSNWVTGAAGGLGWGARESSVFLWERLSSHACTDELFFGQMAHWPQLAIRGGLIGEILVLARPA